MLRESTVDEMTYVAVVGYLCIGYPTRFEPGP